jgi:hypothetical protein
MRDARLLLQLAVEPVEQQRVRFDERAPHALLVLVEPSRF